MQGSGPWPLSSFLFSFLLFLRGKRGCLLGSLRGLFAHISGLEMPWSARWEGNAHNQGPQH